MNNKSIGERIRRRREEMGLTQTDVAGMIGITQASYNKFENGQVKNIVNKHFEAIATALQTDIYSFLPSYCFLEDKARMLEEDMTARYEKMLADRDAEIGKLERTIRDKDEIISLMRDKTSLLRQELERLQPKQ